MHFLKDYYVIYDESLIDNFLNNFFHLDCFFEYCDLVDFNTSFGKDSKLLK